MEIPFEEEQIEIKRDEVKDPIEKKPRKQALTCPNKVSSFFITINTNYHVADKSEEDVRVYKKKFAVLLAETLPKFHEFIDFKTSKLGTKFGYSLEDSKDILMRRVIENQCKYVLEISPTNHRLHCHILFYMKKKGVDTKINMPKLKKHFEEGMGHPCYCNYKLVPCIMNLEEYLKKNPLND